MLSRYSPHGINANFTSISGAAAGVSLSLAHALSEYHPLSNASARLASKRNLEGNLPRKHALSALSARPVSHLSLLALSAPGSLSQSSLTRAKRENGAKRTFEDKKPFLKLEVENQRERSVERRECEEQRTEVQNKARKQDRYQGRVIMWRLVLVVG